MIVIGIDPGTRHLGWGVLRGEGNRITHVAHGVIDPPINDSLARRLVHIDRELAAVLAQFQPSVGSVESLFFHKDPQAAAKLGHARGVVLLNLARAGLEVMEYPPARVKSTVAGNGRAEKQQMVRMVRMLLCLDDSLREDAADALAIALTYLRRAPVEQALAAVSTRIASRLAAAVSTGAAAARARSSGAASGAPRSGVRPSAGRRPAVRRPAVLKTSAK
ncbi:MAG: Holliday Junction Resolvase RuvC [Pseudomonadota bacterium]|jgi:crossover junction endodeoxyribonuclease RuvC